MSRKTLTKADNSLLFVPLRYRAHTCPSGIWDCGRDAVVVDQTDTTVTIIRLVLGTIELVEVDVADLHKEYIPDFWGCPYNVGYIMYGGKRIMRASEAACVYIDKLLELDPVPHCWTQKVNMSDNKYRVVRDHQGRTALVTYSDDQCTQFIPVSSSGFEVYELRRKEFDMTWREMPDYPPEKCAKLIMSFALYSGATKEALNCLRNITTVTDQEYNMAIAKKTAPVTPAKAAAEKLNATAATKTATETKPTGPVKVAAKGSEKPAKEKVAKEPKERQPSAASVFQDLIKEGRLTDDEIFAKVQAQFGLDESKRSYVAWYRNHLRKKEGNPDAYPPVGSDAPKAAKATKAEPAAPKATKPAKK